MKNSIFLIAIGILISIFRLSIEGNEHINLVYIMAFINIIAFDYVILLITIDIKEIVKQKLSISYLTSEQKKIYEKRINLLFIIFYFLTFVLFSIIYVIYLRSSSLNDVLAIMALMISISQNQISEFIGDLIYKLI